MCLAKGIPDRLNDWYQLVTTMELDLMEYKGHGRFKSRLKRNPKKRALGKKAAISSVSGFY